MRGLTSSPNCASCPFALNGQPRNPVASEFPENPKFIVLGLEPGEQEIIANRPFIGKSGQMVESILKSLNVPREEVFIGNCALCKPDGWFDDKDRKKAYECCRPRLNEELRRFPGKPMVVLGGAAAKSFLNFEKITEIAGTYHLVDVDGSGPRAIVPTVHPAMILRQDRNDVEGNKEENRSLDLLYWFIGYDIGKVANLAEGNLDPFKFDVEIEFEDPDRATFLLAIFAEMAYEHGSFSFDVENYAEEGHSALEWKFSKMTAIGFGLPHYAISLRWDIINPSGFKIIRELLESKLEKIAHNKPHDIQVMYKHGFETLEPTHDTVLGHHVAFPGAPHKLQRVGSQYKLIPPWKSDFRGSTNKETRFKEPNWAELLEYNGRDCQITAAIWAPIKKRVVDLGLWEVYELRNRISNISMDIARNGIPFDLDINAKLQHKYKPIVEEIERNFLSFLDKESTRETFFQRLAMETGKIERKSDPVNYRDRVDKRISEYKIAYEKGKFKFKPKAAAHMAAYFLTRGIPLIELTKKGKLSTKKIVLQKFEHLPEVSSYITYREACKLLSVYIENIPKFVCPDGRAYTTYSVHKLTNRWGSKDPPIQTFPGKKSGDHYEVRSQVRAKDGYVLVGADGAQLEARIIALYSGDPYLLKIFEDGLDLHTEMTKLVFGDSWYQLEDEKRQKAREVVKIVEYGKFYGAKDETVWKQAKKDYPNLLLADVAKVGKAIEQKTTIVHWHQKLLNRVATEGKIVAIGGMTRFFPLRRGDKSAIVNWGVQTAGAYWFDSSLVRLYDALKGYSKEDARVIIPLHDAPYLEVRECLQNEVVKLVQESFTQYLEYEGRRILIPAKAKKGKDWCEVG